jgi:dTDP-4-dehydrorhamnose reductase
MIVVTGASGLLGASVLLHARSLGLQVVGLYHGHPLQVPGTTMRRMNLIDFPATRELLLGLKPEAIIHCAAATNVDWCEAHPVETEKVNVGASSLLAEVARDLRAQLIYVSTDAVFDGRQGNYSETDQPLPLNLYGRSKLLGEREVLERQVSALIVRVNIYGWNAQEKLSLGEWFLRHLREQEHVPGFTDVTFCPMLVNDLAVVLLQMLDRRLSGLYHVSGAEKISKYEFGRRVATTFGLDPGKVVPTKVSEANLKACRPLDISLNTEKIHRAMGFEMPGIEAGLNRFRALYDDGYPQQLRNYLTGAAA